MAQIIELTQLSPTMSEGTFVKWHKSPGDSVEPGDILAEVETDKAVMEMESYEEGILLLHLAKEGEVLKLGAPIAIIGEIGEDISELQKEAEERKNRPVIEEDLPKKATVETTTETAVETKTNSVEETMVSPEKSSGERVFASPLARKIADEKGIEISKIPGSGPRGRIVKKDVLKYENNRPLSTHAEPRPDRKIPITGMRRIIAERLHDSKNNIPHYYLVQEIDALPLHTLREKVNFDLSKAGDPKNPIKLSINDFIVKACALALQKHPICNSSWRNDHILTHGRIDVGIAVAIEGGLVTPYIRNADQQNLQFISQKSRELILRARERKLQPAEYSDGTFTISNLGMFGITQFTAIINEPEAALLAVGGIKDDVKLENGTVIAGKTLTVTMSCDHRVIDGAEGALFLNTLKNYLEHPLSLLTI